MKSGKKILVSGVKPTGRPHIGNYFGAMKRFVELQDEFDSYLFIADLHALTSFTVTDTINAASLPQSSLDLAIDYLAIGLDPKKVTLYKQSDVPQVTELAWMFNCITTMPYLMRAHAFKDAEAKNKEINVGVFDYPLLMAADILLPGANVVPVGLDQKQHLEIARDTAEKFNRLFGETFVMPEPLIEKRVMTVPGIDGQKMSKSYGNTIPLFAEDDEITKLVMKIPTDSKGVDEPKNPDECKTFALHTLFASPEELAELRARYEMTGGAKGIGYKEAKEMLAHNIIRLIAPLRAKRETIARDPEYVIDVLKEGAKKMTAHADKKMAEIRKKVGLSLQ